ncbi:MAG TPA: hypothetical protein VNA88_08680 [Candidatus Kapabacteria bacterium]|jgi:hypothetical protein|nr:hypothetical protein [Candidatus Kapabacteria bacterium]
MEGSTEPLTRLHDDRSESLSVAVAGERAGMGTEVAKLMIAVVETTRLLKIISNTSTAIGPPSDLPDVHNLHDRGDVPNDTTGESASSARANRSPV